MDFYKMSEKNRNDQKVSISSRSIQFMIAIFGIFSFTLVNITVIVRQFHPKWKDSPSSMILQTGITLFGFLIIIFLVVISQLNKTSEMLIEEESKHESIDKYLYIYGVLRSNSLQNCVQIMDLAV
ncbi:unnamed protein product [Schistosoma guineensis]|nr:unnamed protein product [Schistosoma guineensis]